MKNLANVTTIEEFKMDDNVITHFKINGETVGSFAATPTNVGKTRWEVEMAYWEEGQIEIIDSFKHIEGNYKSYLKYYIDIFMFYISLAHKSTDDIEVKLDKLDNLLYTNRADMLGKHEKYYTISKPKQSNGKKIYSVKRSN